MRIQIKKFSSNSAALGVTVTYPVIRRDQKENSSRKFKTYLSIPGVFGAKKRSIFLYTGNCAFLTLNSPLTPSSPLFGEYTKAVRSSLNKIKKIQLQFANEEDKNTGSLSITLFVSQYIKNIKSLKYTS